MFKRSQRQVADNSKHWYQDKYQHVLVQRNIMAFISLVALGVALLAVGTVARLAPLKSVEPYLLQVEEKSGIIQTVPPITHTELANDEVVDRYFVALYIRTREGYNPTIRLYNDNIIRLMSDRRTFYQYREANDPGNKDSLVARMGALGQRSVVINNISYINNPVAPQNARVTPERIMQVRFTSVDNIQNVNTRNQQWVATVTFVYADVELKAAERLLNPLGFRVINYQVEQEIA